MGFLMTKPKGHPDVLFVNFHSCNVKFQLLNYSSIHKANAFNKAIMGDNLDVAPQLPQTPTASWTQYSYSKREKTWVVMCFVKKHSLMVTLSPVFLGSDLKS